MIASSTAVALVEQQFDATILDEFDLCTICPIEVDRFTPDGVGYCDEHAERRQWIEDFVGRLWEGLDGYACLWRGLGGHFDARDSYKFADVAQEFYVWPHDRERFIGKALASAETADVYTTPMLRSSRSRKKGTGTAGRHLWVDLDGTWTEDRSEALRRLMTPGSFVILSGSGRHAYVALIEAQPPEKIEELNRRLAVALDGDAKWEGTSLLRLPGTWNHKARAKGGTSALVCWGHA